MVPVVLVMPAGGVLIEGSPVDTPPGAEGVSAALGARVSVGMGLGAFTTSVGGLAPPTIGVAVALPALPVLPVSQAVATNTSINKSTDAKTGDFLCK